jgi:hypothetical protein
MTTSRRPLQGVLTILRFNWHFFALAAAGLVALLVSAAFLPRPFDLLAVAAAQSAALLVLVSLAASYLAYDASGLYRLDWLAPLLPPAGTAANIHAGFDETSAALRARFPRIDWTVFDFYDPAKHTEISIRRARAATPPQPGTLPLPTTASALASAPFDRVLLFLAAHEIRDHAERVAFFRTLRGALAPGGAILVVEHLRDPANLLAYNLGAWHFHTAAEWLSTFREAGLLVGERRKLNPFITLFVLRAA